MAVVGLCGGGGGGAKQGGSRKQDEGLHNDPILIENYGRTTIPRWGSFAVHLPARI
jgi:hypothetical protein